VRILILVSRLPLASQRTAAVLSVLVFAEFVFALAFAALDHQFVAWRRSAGERRQQLKWLACGAAAALGVQQTLEPVHLSLWVGTDDPGRQLTGSQ